MSTIVNKGGSGKEGRPATQSSGAVTKAQPRQDAVSRNKQRKNVAKKKVATAKRGTKNVEVSRSVGAVVLNSKYQVLLVFQKKNRYWEFPKGKIEAGERELDTLKREIFEETGIRRFRMVQGFRRVMYYDFRFQGRVIQRKVVYFLIKTADKVEISAEHSRFTWMSLQSAKKRLKHKNQISLLDDVIKQIYG
ncbi:MAG: hypothetical protein COW24_05980 [Candidatus Kerfeldbacteria bacterium CG15_BIG_FIL_POST_REV_8_21_14_020_45_12]|uniref:Bis(5'-nucleosyl)-tetraphosphatase [asymmetrical] n=1 Tax=Candidatus Kerfeldbacteria bacterium CG15_BIG_FIL_POST_REV_8_21_14_020_45_12 TaxID=2014247 RepID=A0A2M7H269_9BACT|nr:MAG: hypothetical protein COW24_05980 [Candidatus Kerfeldbacteria bacterium CG15_BIG_FIL_POST_REV_8_21_14_020_45_12]PJA92973.1 MAG: hypothetical protein CO132_05230 [Candidatus Kerfeldbacteria bacterium CG_4_9_14_3_um_filter_45_8]